MRPRTTSARNTWSRTGWARAASARTTSSLPLFDNTRIVEGRQARRNASNRCPAKRESEQFTAPGRDLPRRNAGWPRGAPRRIGILRNEHRSDGRVRPADRNGGGPVVGVEIAEQRSARHHLIVEDGLAVVARVDLREFRVGALQDRRDPLRLGQGHDRVVAQFLRQRVHREPSPAGVRPQTGHGTLISGRASRRGRASATRQCLARCHWRAASRRSCRRCSRKRRCAATFRGSPPAPRGRRSSLSNTRSARCAASLARRAAP